MPQVFMTFERVAPGASVTLTWDGRGAVAYYTYQDCSLWEGGGPACASMANAALRPVVPGMYAASFGVASAPPSANSTLCRATPLGFQCALPASGQVPAGACDGTTAGVPTTFVQQAFALPASGAVTVGVSIP
jgi:hypothetical protein